MAPFIRPREERLMIDLGEERLGEGDFVEGFGGEGILRRWRCRWYTRRGDVTDDSTGDEFGGSSKGT